MRSHHAQMKALFRSASLAFTPLVCLWLGCFAEADSRPFTPAVIVGSGRLVLRTTDPESALINESVAFSPDGKELAAGRVELSQDQAGNHVAPSAVVFICGASDGSSRAQIALPDSAGCSLAYSPDGLTLAIGLAKEVKLYDSRTNRERATLKLRGRGYFESLAFSPDARTLATASYDSVVVWDLTSGQAVAAFNAGTGMVHSVSFAPDGKTLASALEGPREGDLQHNGSASSAVAGEIRLWNLQGKPIGDRIEFREPTYAVCFSPDGQTLATAGNDGARLIDRAGKTRTYITTTPVHCLAYSRDGRYLALGMEEIGYEGAPGEVRLWDTETGQDRVIFQEGMSRVHALAFTPDGRTLAGATRDGVFLWDIVSSLEHRLKIDASRLANGRRSNVLIGSLEDLVWLLITVLSFVAVPLIFVLGVRAALLIFEAQEDCQSFLQNRVRRDGLSLRWVRMFLIPVIYRVIVEDQSGLQHQGWAIITGTVAKMTTGRRIRFLPRMFTRVTTRQFVPQQVKYLMMRPVGGGPTSMTTREIIARRDDWHDRQSKP